jgi:hypothetical protein
MLGQAMLPRKGVQAMSCCTFRLSFSLIVLFLLLAVSPAFVARPVVRHAGGRPNQSVIRVWTVGSPYRAETPRPVPLDIQDRAKALGYTIELTNFAADGFSARFTQAFREHNEPEILTMDNAAFLFGMNGPNLPHVDGILNENGVAGSLILEQETLTSLQPRGWVFLLRSAADYEAARALAMQPTVCSQLMGGKVTAPEKSELQNASDFAIAAARSYLNCDVASLTAMSDLHKLSTRCLHPNESSQVDNVETCSISGNENLAFAFVGSAFSAQAPAPSQFIPYQPWFPNAQIGHQTLLTILKKEGGKWRLLAISADSVSRYPETRLSTEHISSLLTSGFDESIPTPAQIITPDGTYPKRQGNQFGDLTWKPSTSPDVIAEIAEFVMTSRTRLDEPTRLLFVDSTAGRLSTGLLFGGGRFQWRVWSINKNGNIAFSDPRWYIYP